MSDIRLGNSGKININNLKAGIKKEQIQHDEKLQKLFDAVDTHKDGVLDDNEIEQFKKQILEQAGNDKLSNREANKFLKNLKMEHITKEDLFEFIETLSQEGENITESLCVSDKKGNKTYKITYKDNSTELINDDLSRDVVTKGDNGETIVKHFKKDANKPSTITVKKQDGSTETTKMDEDGKPIEKVVVDKDGNTTTTVIGEKNLPTMQKVIPKSGTPIEIIIMDEKGKPKSKTVENGATIEEYTYDEKDNPVLNTKSENKGIPAKEKITTYTYNEDGTTIATTKEANKQTELITKGGDFISETVTNDKGHRLSQTKNVDGQLYTKSYDGNGNTLGVIVQNGESISALAEKFGCSVDDIIKANKGLVQGKGKDAYFLVGTEIKIPREIDADDKVFEGRTSSEEAIEGYSAYMQTKAAEEAQKAQEAQQAQETQETQEAQEKTQKELQEKQREAKEIAEGMYNACTAKRMGSIGHEDFQTPLKKINEQNASAVISQHNAAHPEESLVALICNEKMSSNGDRKEALTHIMNQLAAEARAKGIPEADIKKYVNEFNISMKAEFKKVGAISPNKMEACMKALHGLVLSADVKADEITDQEAIESFNETAKGEYENAETQYNTAREKEGWTAKTGDTVLGWFGCITKEDMDGKLAAYKGDIEKLQNCKTEAEFKKAYEEVFGIPFDKKKIAAYETAKAEMQLAAGAKASADSMQQLYNEARGLDYEAYKAKVADAFKGNPSEDGKPTGLTPEDIDEIVDALSVDYMKKHPHADKKDVLRHFVDMQKQKQMEIYNDVTKGRSIEQMDKELDSIRQSAFGTKDIVNDVIQYNQNQEMTGMAVEMAGEIAATAALQAIPGLGQLAAAKLAVSAAKWGTRGAKFLKYAKNASNIMTKASTSLEKGAKGLEKVNKAINSSKASRIATNTGAAFVGTTGVDLSNGKSVKEALQKGMQNAVFAGAGGFSNEFAPILSKTLGLPNKVSKELADEIAEAALDLLTSSGASVAMLGEYTSTDAFMDLATGIIMNRLGKVGVKNAGQKPEQPQTPVTDKASSNGSAQPSSVKVGEAKAEKIADEVDAVVSNPETSGEELARVRQEVDGLQNRDLRRDAEQKIDNAAENLSPEEKAKYEAAKKANAEKNINHIFEKHSELTSADARVLSEYIQNTDDIEVLNKLRQQLADKEHSYGGITANYDKLRGAIDKKVAELQPTPAKINTEQRENVVNMLKEKATTGKGLNENEFKELTAYISTITSDDDLKEIKNLIGGKKMTSAQKKELKELLATKTDSIKAQSASAETNTAAKTEDSKPVTKSTEKVEDINPANSEITAGSLYDIKNPEEFVNQLKQALPDAELAKTLDGLSAEDADILKRAYNDIFPNGGDEFALNDFNELLQSLQNRSKKNNTKLADELQLIDKILKAPSAKNGEIIDCVLMSRIPTEEKVLDNIERLLKLKETCDNPLLNIDNIIVISGKFKDIDDIEVLVKRFEAKNPDGSYKYNVDEYDEFSVDPTAVNKLKQNMLDSYKDKPEIHKGISEFFENADLESIKDFKTFIYNSDEKKFLYNLRQNTPKTIMSDIKMGLDSISDVDFKKMIDEMIAEIENSDMSQITKAKKLREQRQLVDSYNNLTDNYATIEAGEHQIWGSYWKDYLNYIKQNDSALEKLIKGQGNSRGGIAAKFENFVKKRYEDLKDIFITDNKNHREILNSMVKEFEESQRIELFVDYCKNNNDKACNKIYKDVYLNRSDFTPEIKQKLSDISDKFGVKVFLDSNITADTDKCLQYIEKELAEWKKASNGSAKMPPVLDFTGAKKDYYDNTSAYGHGKTAGFSESASSGAISMYGCTLEQLEWSFRHEMTHSNDLKRLHNFPEGFLSKAGDTTIAQDSKFFEELVEIGVDPSHAPYAYNNPEEFIAVASEGDLSKCSPELRQTLLDFGMPEWQFNMKSKADLVQEVVDLKANKIADDAKDFKLCTSVKEAEKLYDKLISKRWIGEADLKDGEPIYWSPNGWAQAMYKNDHPQGTPWKMHMYANSPEEWANVAQLAMPYLHKNEVVYKTVTDLDDHFNVLREPIEGQSISTQTGKAFTIYFESEEQFLQVAKDLEKIFDASGLKSSGKTYGEAQIGESGFLSYRHEYAERGTQYKPDNIDDPYLNSKNTNNLDSKDVEFGTGVARPQYKAGVDYEQPAPTLKQYTDDELLSQFDNKELNSNDFYKIKEDIYNDIRLSGKYSAEESLNCKFEDIEDFNSPYGKVYYTDGWLVHSFDNGCKNLAVDRVSLSVKADPKMLEELDRLLAKGEYQDATGKTHKLSDEAFTKGSYKTDTSAEEWMTRHDPITMYFDETVSKEMLDAIAVVTDKYKRIPSKELSGAVEGCPWIANEPYVTPEQVYDLITRANHINKELGDMINKEAGSYLDLSSGDYLACKKVVDDYERYLEIKSKIDNEKITNPQPIEDTPAPELGTSNIKAVKNDAPDNSIEIAKQRATRELELEKAEQVALQKEQEYIDKTYNSKKSASESADVFKADFAQKEAAAKALNQVKLEKAEQAAVEREQAYIDRTYGTTHKSASESADVFNADFAQKESVAKALHQAKLEEANKMLASLQEKNFNRFQVESLKEAINNNPDLAIYFMKQIDEKGLKYSIEDITEFCSAKELNVTTFKNYLKFYDDISKILPKNYDLKFNDMVLTLSKHSISDMNNFISYMKNIDLTQIQNILPNLSRGYKEHWLLDFISHHYNKGTVEFTPNNLTFSEDLSVYLENNFLNIDKIESLLIYYPYTNRNIGSLPENWLKGVSEINKTTISDKVQDVITPFVKNRWWDEGVDEFQNGLAKVLNKNVKVEYLGSGQYCSAYKISVEGSEPVVIKKYQLHDDSNATTRGGLHGSKIEPQAGWFASKNTNETVKYYCGRVEGVIDADAYTITEYVSQDSSMKDSGRVNNSKYNIKFTDHASGNKINGQYVDFGAIVVENSNGTPVNIELEKPRDINIREEVSGSADDVDTRFNQSIGDNEDLATDLRNREVANQVSNPKRREDNSHARISQQNSTTPQVISSKAWIDAGVDSNGTNIKLSRNSVGSVIIDRDGRKSLVRFPENTNKISIGKDATGADIILTKQADGSIVLTKQNATKPTPNEQPYTGNDIKLQVMQNGTVIVNKGDRASRIKFPEGVNRVSIGKDATGADLMLVKDNNGELKIMKQNSPASSENPNRLDARVNPYPRKTSADTPVNQKTVQQPASQQATAKNTSSRYVDKPIQNKHLAELAMRKYPNPSDSVKERLLDIDNALANIDDPYLLEQISKMSDIAEIEQITDIMSELNGQSTAFQRLRKDGKDLYYQGSNVADFARTVKSEDAKGFNDLIDGKEVSSLNGNDNVKNLDIDLAEEKRLYSLKEYMKDFGRNDLANYLYSKYYLDGLDISPQAKAKMDNITKTYGTRIFISPSDTKDVDKILAKLENEFEIFEKASNYRWNKPPVVDFNRIKQSYFKKSRGSALSEIRTGSIGFSYMDERELEASLRHELMHSNDWRNARKSEISQEEFNAVFTGDLKVDPETGDVVIDLDKCKYANELRNAGLEDWVIEYGHTSPSELVAVAAEGDMSKYSLEFQNVLKKFGMPEWAFNLPPQVKYYDINSQGSPVKISDDKVAASPFRRLREMFGGSKPKSSINDIFGVPDAIGKRPNFIKGFSNDMGISTSTPVVSTKLKNALELEASGKTLVTQLDANVNPSSISRYVKDGEVCAIGDKLYISDDGVPVELKMTKEKFEELFPPVGCATTEQLGVNTCWLVSRINSMMDSAGGRVRLYSMLEQDGNDILVHLKNRELPIRFTNSKPIYGYPELCLGDNAAPGLDMIFQSVLSERKSMDFGAIAQADVTNALDFDFIEMYKYTGIMQATSLSSHILGTFGQGAYDKNQIKDFIENFVSGKDILNITYGLHHKHIVNYDSETKMVTMHDPYNGGVDRTCLLSDLLAQHDLHAEYWKRRPFNKTSPKVANQPTQTPVSTQANSVTTPQRRRVTIGDGKPRVEEIAKPVETNSAKSEPTQEQVAKPTPARRRVTIGDGKPRVEEIAKPVETNPAKSEPAQEQVAKPAVRSRLVFNQEMQIGTINGRLIKAEYKGLSSDYVATVVVNGRNFEIKAGTKLKIADGLEISCNKFGIVEFLNYQQAPSAPQPKPVSSQDTKTNTSPTPQPKTAVDLPRGFEHNGTMSYRGVECPKARNANGLEILYYNGKWVRLL